MRDKTFHKALLLALALLVFAKPSLAQDSFWKDTGLAIHLGLLSLAQKRLEDYRPASYKDKERALLALAYIHLRRNEKEEANTCLAQIPPSSPYYEAAQALSWAREMKVEEAEGVLPPTSAPFLVFEKTLTQSPVAALDYLLLNVRFLLPQEEERGIKAVYNTFFWQGEDNRVLALFLRFPWLIGDKEAIWKAALAHYRRGDLVDALSLLSILPPSPRTLFWKAKVLRLLGMPGEARFSMKKATRGRGFYALLAQISSGKIPRGSPCPETHGLPPGPLRDLMEMGMEDVAVKVIMNRLWTQELSIKEALSLLSPINPSLAMKLGWQKGSWQGCLLYPYKPLVEGFCRLYGVEVPLAYAVMRQESLFDKRATSTSGALGLMQVLPSTGEFIAQHLQEGAYFPQKLYLPIFGIRYGIWYLSYLKRRFPTLPLVVAAYNAGPQAVKQWYQKWGMASAHEIAEFFPKRETRTYVKRVLTYYLLYAFASK